MQTNAYQPSFNITKSSAIKGAVILQARINSFRFPGKILKKIGPYTIIEHAMIALRLLRGVDRIVATNYRSAGYIRRYAVRYGFELYCGSDNDVLKRFTNIILKKKYQYIIRATADNPFVSAFFAGEARRLFLSADYDYFTFSHLPVGTGVEVVSAPALIAANRSTYDSYHREHVTSFLYNNADRFRLHTAAVPKNCRSDINVSVDTYADLMRVTDIYYMCHSRRPIEPWNLAMCNRYK